MADIVEKNDIKKSLSQKKRTTSHSQPVPPKLKVLFTIVNRKKAELYAELLHQFDVNIQLSMAANGTASKEMLGYLGLVDSEKAVIISVIREDQCAAALKFLEEKFKTIKNGKGIAFTVPITSVIGVATYQFLSNAKQERRTK